jgi:hypothetical protein
MDLARWKMLRERHSEDAVHEWFDFAKTSKFPEGPALNKSKAIQSTLDGY